MHIIKLEPFGNGGRPALQSWGGKVPPEGYALCPDNFVGIFYSTSPAGFVNISVENGTVVNMETNQTALDAYVAALPEVTETEVEPTEEEDTASMLVDHEYRLTLLELGLSE